MFHRLCALLLLSGLIVTLSGLAVPTVTAQTSTTIGVTASINQPATLSVTVCDGSANFGTNIGFHGAAPLNADPGVVVTDEGATGLFYVWSSLCTPAISTTGNVPYTLRLCGTENSGSTSVTLAGNDLRYDRDAGPNTPQLSTSSYWTSQPTVAVCTASPPVIETVSSAPFSYTDVLNLAVRMQSGDANVGTFNSTLTFSVAPS